MKISQYASEGRIRLGSIEGDRLTPLSFEGDMVDFISQGVDAAAEGEPLLLHEIRLMPPVSRPSKIIAIGLNYKDHAEESKGRIPDNPLVFAKFPNSLIGHRETIVWERNVTAKVDFEAELAVVLGKRVYNCPEEEALSAVFGYTCANDVSARDLQFGDGQWVRGKSLDTFCPLGPWIVTSDALPDPQDLKITCRLNGRTMQESHTGKMIFTVARLISFLSRHFTLFPGDLVLTGTPHGVGAFRKPPLYMRDGDVVEVAVEGVGSLINSCREMSVSIHDR
jgi:2-keto-4-pentenoate hydratase/2-oxohepta-3-ene-1,7-dioic acid hydratase in catechol pathway